MFVEFELPLPAATKLLIAMSRMVGKFWWILPLIPIALWLFIKLTRMFKAGRMGWDQFILRVPVIGNLVEKNIMARTSRTLGTLVASGVPILEGLTITRETSNNAMFEKMFAKVADSIREGEVISRPMREHSRPGFHPVAMFFWFAMFALPALPIGFIVPEYLGYSLLGALGLGILGSLFYIIRMNKRIVDELVVNMVDVGEETGELDTMLYKVSDYYDEEVKVLTEGLMKLIEPLLIVFLGGCVGFIVISLFMPLISMITSLSK
jgi:type IV pilus assembly protein PilC